jgi:hypothetical protein
VSFTRAGPSHPPDFCPGASPSSRFGATATAFFARISTEIPQEAPAGNYLY